MCRRASRVVSRCSRFPDIWYAGAPGSASGARHAALPCARWVRWPGTVPAARDISAASSLARCVSKRPRSSRTAGPCNTRKAAERSVPKRQKRARPYVGSKSSETGCAYGPHETHGTTELAGEVSLAAGTVPDHRTQRAYGSAACRASEALQGAFGIESCGDRLHLMTPRDARRHIPCNGHTFSCQDRPGRPRRAG